jgi:hypothetical protein
MASAGNMLTRIIHPRSWNSVAPFWVIALLLGMAQTWANRFYMGNDGVSYLDMADAYLRGDWHTSLNASWNPLYSWLIGLGLLLFRPSLYWEYPLVQAVNFLIYVGTLVSFEYFLRGLLTWTRRDEIVVRVIGYGLFIWSSLTMIGLWTVNADMLVAAFLYLTMGFLLRAHKARIASASVGIPLGITLAAGYYSKAVMFPLGIAVLFIAWIVLGRRCTLIAAIAFVALSAPLITALSVATGHFTIGDTGRVNYAWYVNGVASRWWLGGPAGAGLPQHQPLVLLDSPRLYEFDSAFPHSTYPLWYDFSYWYKGLRVWFDGHRLASVMWSNLKWTLKLLARQGGGFLLGWGVCFLLYENKARTLKNFAITWPAWVVSIAVLLLYSAVHVERRYIGVPFAVLLLTAFMALHVKGKRLAIGIVIVGFGWALVFAPQLTSDARYFPWSSTSGNTSLQAAVGLRNLGLRDDTKVASVCYSNRSNVLWAHLLKAHIVAETAWDVKFWELSAADQRRVLIALAHSGALMAISDEIPPDPTRAVGWLEAGTTKYYAYSLSQLSESVENGPSPSIAQANQSLGR